MNLSPNESRPIFIGGTGRCGTTILADILLRHSSIFGLRKPSSGSMEGRFITNSEGVLPTVLAQDPLLAARVFRSRMLGTWYRDQNPPEGNEKKRRGLYSHIPSVKELDVLVSSFESRLFEAERQEERIQAGASLVTEVFELAMRNESATRWAEKSPSNILYIPELLAMFPNSKFIHIYRDGRDVADSLIEKSFWPIWQKQGASHREQKKSFTIQNAAIYWRDHFIAARAASQRVAAERYMEVSLESLIQKPEESARAICSFIEERFDPMMLKIKLDRGNIGRWRNTFGEVEKQDFKREAGDLLIELDYETDNLW